MHNPPSILSLSFRRQPNKVARFRPEVEIEVKLLKLPQALLQKKKLDKYNTLEKILLPPFCQSYNIIFLHSVALRGNFGGFASADLFIY